MYCMRKFFIFLIIFLMQSTYVFSQETSNYSNAVFLKLDDDDVSQLKDDNIPKGNISYNQINYSEAPLKRNYDKLIYQDVNRPLPQKKSYSKSLEKDISNNTILGATYKTTSSSGDLSDSLSLYSKYKKDRFSFTSSYSQSDLDIRGKKKPGSVSFAPEYSINQHLSLKNVITNNMTDRLRKNEIVISLKPFKDGRMNLDLGAGQTYSYQNEPTKSQLNFSTNFKF